MLFKDVIGQAAIKRRLIDSARNNSVSHAQLFLAPLGHGGLPLALAFSQYLNCEAPDENDSCGKCPSCVKAQKFIHPDIHYSFPFPKIEKKERCDEFIKDWREALLENPYLDLLSWMTRFEAENKQPHISIRECHDIIHKLSLKAYESPCKVMILWLPEFLGNNGNSLLKIIEEPPDKTVFILIAENRDAVLNTVLSRTQILRIPHIEHVELAKALAEKYEVADDNALRLANISNGDFVDAVRQIRQVFGKTAEMLNAWLRLCMPGNHAPDRLLNLYRWIEEFATIGRENQKGFLKYALHFLRESLHAQAIGYNSPVLTREESDLAAQMMKISGMEQWQRLYKLLNDAHYHAERNAHPKMLMMHLSLKVMGALKPGKVAA